MFTVVPIEDKKIDWNIIHNTAIELEHPKIYVHLDKQTLLIGGTTFSVSYTHLTLPTNREV